VKDRRRLCQARHEKSGTTHTAVLPQLAGSLAFASIRTEEAMNLRLTKKCNQREAMGSAFQQRCHDSALFRYNI